ncbi:holo-ACP synthase [Sphaerochaeta halotolerans]|jgi:holo-[acyl-carrier protein] synthase|uniref:Holo-[acyl-carrier-protein] synthase n=1 Tax=Sphaerochaeta halotolerans TaxID=2293840 RepID=A0A372MK44_9SPIR|nr:holo-ACP synthase [Sphaerochaeta halotolerans]MBG0766512.1 holo-ACP synthase [Spirochaetaceae bacterium]MDK2859274.1 holo-[acyl-carrier protein] synthase [Sphaerochaeta sp.]MDN5332805.1 holo-[acyl-carrier protein] synthase [Sphaerochaeta sp.]MXI85173.1 holo-[acyl-carrier-protein] synthase [Sphaerochaeta halotolerans]RFU95758.1 holo-[acyl-carrier-protein] synthase [Sphaerochaeta halotolerans]
MVSGIGVDVVNIQRMERLSDHVKSRIFHPRELDEAKTMAKEVQAEFLAGRFAAKEALGKALGIGLAHLSLQDIWVERAASGKPELHCKGRAQELVGKRTAMLSISHDDPVAIAMVVLVGAGDATI